MLNFVRNKAFIANFLFILDENPYLCRVIAPKKAQKEENAEEL